MKKLRLFALLLIGGTISTSLNAQISYYTGFDNAAEQEGWVEYKTAATTGTQWDYSSSVSFSPTYCLSHDYAPATGIDVIDNWFVSPAFFIPDGGSLDSLRYQFYGFSSPTENDTLGVYLLVGNNNPELASSKILLFDFRGDDYNADAAFRKLTDIALPATEETCYLAIRYRNSNSSTFWLNMQIDNIAITSTGALNIKQIKNESEINIFPNPTKGMVNIENNQDIESLVVYNSTGHLVYSNTINTKGIIQIDASQFPKGIYYIRMQINGEYSNSKFIVQ